MTIEQILLQDIRENSSLEKRALAVATYRMYRDALIAELAYKKDLAQLPNGIPS